MSKGIDYGMGTTNVDKQTGIRFGVIAMHELNEWAHESFEADYGSPCCPKCGNDAVDGDSDIDADALEEIGEEYRKENPGTDADVKDMSRDDFGYECKHGACGDYACDSCRILFDGEDAFGEEAIGFTLDDGEYKATQGGNGDRPVFRQGNRRERRNGNSLQVGNPMNRATRWPKKL